MSEHTRKRGLYRCWKENQKEDEDIIASMSSVILDWLTSSSSFYNIKSMNDVRKKMNIINKIIMVDNR